ncbi:MAG: hypothetical protein K6C12_10075 [Oscillospiraceae bacterium]|nr:hypothetical protein [Oscillospiraceae bacterium]
MDTEQIYQRIDPWKKREYFPGGLDQAQKVVSVLQRIADIPEDRALAFYLNVAEVVSLFQRVDNRTRNSLAETYGEFLPGDKLDTGLEYCRKIFEKYDREAAASVGTEADGQPEGRKEQAAKPAGEPVPSRRPEQQRESPARRQRTGQTSSASQLRDRENSIRAAEAPERSPLKGLLIALIVLLVLALAAVGALFFMRRTPAADPGQTSMPISTPTPEPTAAAAAPVSAPVQPAAVTATAPVASAPPTETTAAPALTSAAAPTEQAQASMPAPAVQPAQTVLTPATATAAPEEASPITIAGACAACGKLLTAGDVRTVRLSAGGLILCDSCYQELIRQASAAAAAAEQDLTDSYDLADPYTDSVYPEEEATETEDEVPVETRELPNEWTSVTRYERDVILPLMIDFPWGDGVKDDTSVEEVAYFPELKMLAVTLTREPSEVNVFKQVPVERFWEFYDSDSPYTYYWNKIYTRYPRDTFTVRASRLMQP